MKRDDTTRLQPAAAALSHTARNTDAAWLALYEAACAPYRQGSGFRGRWAWHWARGKLGRDPVFRGMLERGDLLPDARVVDIGCGQGLVASLLHACADAAARGNWPAAWPAAPSARSYQGVELMPLDVARGNAALQRLHRPGYTPHIEGQDMRHAVLPACDEVVILDVLHYVGYADQDAVLARVRDALQAGRASATDNTRPARLLLRVGDAAHSRGIAITKLVDWIVTTARGHRVPPTFVRTLDDWVAALQALGFGTVHRVPMSQGTPFANVLLVADLKDSA